MNEPTVVTVANKLYARMQTAIRDCHSLDECKAIANQAHAIAAYYKQTQDDESVCMFLEVKLRAWRRIGEICLTIDESDCTTQTMYIDKIRAAYPGISANHVYQALRIGRIPADFYQREVTDCLSVSAMLSKYQNFLNEQWAASDAGQAELRKRKEQQARHEAEYEKQAQHERKEREELEALKAAKEDAFSEVGITMDRRDRAHMKQIVLLVKEAIHETLRKAAFDQHMTMQAILRAGLAMWFAVHGYAVDTDDMALRSPKRRPESDASKRV